jgi:lysine-N-methylase
VCREFPRLRHDYGSFAELGLELSCPEAARLILTGDSSPVVTTISGGEAPEYDLEAMEILRATRSEIIEFLQESTYTPPQMLAILLLYAHEVQSQLDGGDTAVLTPEQMLRQAEGYAAAADINKVFSFFLNLEILTPQWKARLEQGPVPGSWTAEFPALAIYFIGRYWLQAVSDYDLIGRVKFAITACLLVHALGGDPVETAQQFSKEIENNPDNVDAILDGAYASPALTDLQLLGLLLLQ